MTALLPSTPMLLAFLAATLVTLIVPGPSVVYVVTRSIEQGRRAGLYSMLGLETGAAVHLLAATLGLAALLASSTTAFTVLKVAGACYLVWLAVRHLRRTSGDLRAPHPAAAAPFRLYLDGVLVDVLNPKTAAFFLAFLPQFVDPTRPPGPQLAVLGLLFVGLAAIIDGGYAVLAGRVSRRLRSSSRARRRLHVATGGVYLALAGVAVIA